MNDKIVTLDAALDKLAKKLRSTPRSAPGYRAMRDLYRDLHIELINVWRKTDEEIARAIEKVAQDVKEEWESTDSVQSFVEDAKSIARAVGGVLTILGVPNPLAFLV